MVLGNPHVHQTAQLPSLTLVRRTLKCSKYLSSDFIYLYVRLLGIAPLVEDGPIIPDVPAVPIPVGDMLASLSYGQ